MRAALSLEVQMKRSKHSLSHYRLTTWNQGELYPVMCSEVLPGDSFRHQASVLMRVSPLVAPVMHPVHLMVHSWFVPSRLVWDNFEDFITGKNTNLVYPLLPVNSADADAWRLVQAMGVGADTRVTDISLVSLPFRAYNLIYNEFYRDQHLNTALTVNTGDAADDPAIYAIRKGSWEKDYFTTARPYPQQGSDTEVVQLSLTGEAPIKGLGKINGTFASGAQTNIRESDGTQVNYTTSAQIGTATGYTFAVQEGATGYPNIRADLSGVAAGSVNMDINEWRRSMAMQRIREHRNRFGSRYRDMLAFLGVNSSDSRLQRPEYLGGGKQTVSFSEVLSTADTGTAVLGDMGGHGIAALRTRPYKRFFEEHGYVITLVFVRPATVYMNSVPRHFLRRDYEDVWQKELEMLGEQPITNTEVYGDTVTPSTTFGYIPRYDEYRHAQSFVSGEFRTILDYWHMARKFGSQPVLNGSFVGCDPTDRIYAATENDQLYGMIAHRLSARRLVSHRARS